MESTRGYAEPELQKMAVFLKQRCNRGQYGLTYYNVQKTMVKIPWPIVPRQNEDVSEIFGMFTEWAYLSFRKRGHRGKQHENETLNQQKHRFRNALAHADGLRQCKQLSTEKMKVYEFVDTKKDRHQTENGIQRHNQNAPPNPFEQERMDLPPYPIYPCEYSDSNQILEYQDCWGRPMTVTPSLNHTPGYHNTGVFQVSPEATAMLEDRQPSLDNLLGEIINTQKPTLPDAQTNASYNVAYAVTQPVQFGVSVGQPVQNSTVTSSPNHTPGYYNTGVFQVSPEATAMQEDRQPSLDTLLGEIINTQKPTLPDAQTNGSYNVTYAVTQPVQFGVSVGYLVQNSTVTSSPNHTPGYHNTGVFEVSSEAAAMQEDRHLSTLIEEIINTPEPTLPYAQANGRYNATNAVPQPVQVGVSVAQPVQNNYRMINELQVPTYVSPNQANGALPHIAQLNHHLRVKVYFREEEVMQKPVTNSFGFRLYSGNNIPDMRRLLDERQQNQLKAMSKYHSDCLFGPENLEQVEMPTLHGPVQAYGHGVHMLRVIDNMDRGILFFLDDEVCENKEQTIPNVFAVRLCQTRVYPSETNVQNRDQLKENGLKRSELVQIFDGSEFTQQMDRWVSHRGPTPASTISMSVGQKPKSDKTQHNLVSITISVTKAKLMVEKYLEDQMGEIIISEKTSIDKAAKQHEEEVCSRIQFDDTAVY